MGDLSTDGASIHFSYFLVPEVVNTWPRHALFGTPNFVSFHGCS